MDGRRNDAILVNLIVRHLLDTDHGGTDLIVGLNQLAERRLPVLIDYNIVAQQHGKGFMTDKRFCTQDVPAL